MLRLILVYASSAGLQRAIVFLATPFLSRQFVLEDLGTYTLVQTASQLIIPVLTWNTTVALTREANDHPGQAAQLLRLVSRTAAFIGLIGLLSASLTALPPTVTYVVMLGAAEAAFACAVAVLQGRESANHVLAISLLKTIAFVTLIGLVVKLDLDLQWLLSAQVANSAASAIAAVFVARNLLDRTASATGTGITIRQMVAYSAATLPHTIALWISLSADRLLLGMLRGTEAVGSYVLAYTVAQAVLLMTAGIIAALPPRVARDPRTWREAPQVVRFVRLTSIAAFLIALALLAFVFLNKHWHAFIPNMPDNAPVLVALISAAFYSSIYYVLFASYMYLNRRTEALARSGFYVAPFNLFVMALLVYYLGPVGAALGLLVSYASFGVAYGYVAVKLEPTLIPAVRPLLTAACALVGSLLVAAAVIG